MQKILSLQKDGRQTQQGIPGTPFAEGLPVAGIRRAGEQAAAGGGGPSMATAARAGTQGGQINAARAQADAQAQVGSQVA